MVTYLYAGCELDAAQLAALYAWAVSRGYPNIRVITPRLVQWARVFHPRFYAAASRSGVPGPPLPPLRLSQAGPLTGVAALSRFRCESTTFLAAVTLSAAIIQSRWSEGTLSSKYDRLWQLGLHAEEGSLDELAPLDLKAVVRELASTSEMPATDRLLAIREQFELAVARLTTATATACHGAVIRAGPVPPHLRGRFGFVDGLRQALGHDLQCIVVYGSSVSGPDFADYDALIVSRDPRSTLRLLADTSPTWHGKELNLGVYSPQELWNMQVFSGDNLADYGLCVYGEVEVPTKPKDLLLARNLSFGTVRLGQQLGMIGPAFTVEPERDDRRNLYDYFVKIPANVAKGTWGALGRQVAKADVYEWLRTRCGFDTRLEQAAATGSPGNALAAAAVATGNAMEALDADLAILERAA